MREVENIKLDNKEIEYIEVCRLMLKAKIIQNKNLFNLLDWF